MIIGLSYISKPDLVCLSGNLIGLMLCYIEISHFFFTMGHSHIAADALSHYLTLPPVDRPSDIGDFSAVSYEICFRDATLLQ